LILLGSGAFKGCQGSKGPAGTTVTLVLDGNHITIGEVVNISGSVDEMTTTSSSIEQTTSSVISKCGLLGVSCGHVEAKKLLILFWFEIGCPIVAKDEDIRVATASSLAIIILDDIVIQVIPVLLSGECGCTCHILVVLGAVLEELGIITEFTTGAHTTTVRTGSSDTNQGGQGKGSFHQI
jgi:hypothetical protein